MGVGAAALEDLVMQGAFWQGRKVLVTGHTGFKGSWLSLWLSAAGARVAGYALECSTTPSLYEAARVGSRIHSTIGDVRDAGHLRKAMDEAAPEVVFHLAAQSLVRESYRAPVDTYATNVLGTVHCLEAARRCASVRAVVVATSDKCYENLGRGAGYVETDRLGGDDPYSSSKACAELVGAAYAASFFAGPGTAGVATVRAGNVIGGGDWAAERIVPDAMRAFSAAQALKVRHPGFVRPWQHVLEPLAGYLLLAERLCGAEGKAFATAWNFGPPEDEARPVSWIAAQLAARWGEGASWKAEGQDALHEAAMLKLDCSRAKARLGWSPRLPLESALDWTVEWYRAHARGEDVAALALGQIARYERL